MKNQTKPYTPNVILAIAGSVLLATMSVASEGRLDQPQAASPPAAQAATPPAAAPQMSDEELAKVGEPLVAKVCGTSCHGLEKIDEMRRTPKDWSDQVRTMKLNGAQATEPQFATISKYLTRYYGVVAVNTAPAEELSAVVGFTAKDAQAIVAYRTANGPFADLAALRKVPGIDAAKIDDQPDALRFNK